MKRLSLLAAVLCTAAPAASLAAQTAASSYPVDPYERPYTGATPADVPREATLVTPGMRVQVLSTGVRGYRRNGTLRFANADSISVATASGEVVTVATPVVDGLSVSLGRSAGKGALRGLWMGGAAGLVLLPLAGNNGGDEASNSITTIARPENVAIGAAVGALVGGLWGREVWRRAARATPGELARVKRTALSGARLAPFAAAPLGRPAGTFAAGLSIRF
jgi:hypothetical protein